MPADSAAAMWPKAWLSQARDADAMVNEGELIGIELLDAVIDTAAAIIDPQH